MSKLAGVKCFKSRFITAKILIVDDDFNNSKKDSPEQKDRVEFFINQADIIITEDGVIIKSRLTNVPTNIDLKQCKNGGHLDKLRKAMISSAEYTRKIKLD